MTDPGDGCSYFVPILGPLSSYRWISARVACQVCPRRGRYRLARLTESYGAETDLSVVLKGLSRQTVPYRTDKFRNAGGCKAFFPDIEDLPSKPPDLPDDMRRPRLAWKQDGSEPPATKRRAGG